MVAKASADFSLWRGLHPMLDGIARIIETFCNPVVIGDPGRRSQLGD
jgi:hypothetical protein